MSTSNGTRLDPTPIMRLATCYWDSRCFLTANRLGVFDVLAEGPLTAERVAATLHIAPRPTRLLLKACVGLGLLEEDEKGFRNDPRTQMFLVRGSRAFLGDAVRYASDMWEAWTRLDTALYDDAPPIRPEEYTGADPEKTHNFVFGMHNRALAVGEALVPLVDLGGRRRLLDVGGGSGTYSALFTKAYPGLQSTVMDLPDVVMVAEKVLISMEASDDVGVLAGDYRTTPFPAGNDAVLISGVFHRETEETCRDLIARGRDALNPSGCLVVSDVFTEAGGASPAFAALFGLNMMLSAPEGGVHADTDVCEWMRDAGFKNVECRPFPPPMPHRVVIGSL